MGTRGTPRVGTWDMSPYWGCWWLRGAGGSQASPRPHPRPRPYPCPHCPHCPHRPPPQASQVNDATKYAVAVAVVRVLAPHRPPPRFARPAVRAFVPAGAREAALVTTFGGHVLALRAHDPDFPEGINPQVRYSLRPRANHSQLFQLMPNGLLVARADRLRPAQTYSLQVLARDEESGETSNTTVELEVLWPGQAGTDGLGGGPRPPGVPSCPPAPQSRGPHVPVSPAPSRGCPRPARGQRGCEWPLAGRR
nr:uncharacterized protein LOC125181292 [Anser cygnoides]